MLYTSVDKLTVSNQVYKFMCNLYPNLEKVDIEVIPTDLTEDNVFGWCLENNNQFEIEIHHNLGYFDFVTTLIHELVHVDQTLRGLFDDQKRENEAYKLEKRLAKDFMKCRNALTMEKVKRLYPEYDFTNATLEICY